MFRRSTNFIEGLCRHKMAYRVGVFCLVAVFCGCGQTADTKRMGFKGPAPIVPSSDAIANFMGREGMNALYLNFDELPRDTEGTRTVVTQPKFIELYEAFKNEPIPKAFKSVQREKDKSELTNAIDALIEGAKKKVPDNEFRQLAEPIRPAAQAFMRPTNY